MINFIQGFFENRMFGVLAILSLGVAAWLSWNVFKEIRGRKMRRVRIRVDN